MYSEEMASEAVVGKNTSKIETIIMGMEHMTHRLSVMGDNLMDKIDDLDGAVPTNQDEPKATQIGSKIDSMMHLLDVMNKRCDFIEANINRLDHIV